MECSLVWKRTDRTGHTSRTRRLVWVVWIFDCILHEACVRLIHLSRSRLPIMSTDRRGPVRRWKVLSGDGHTSLGWPQPPPPPLPTLGSKTMKTLEDVDVRILESSTVKVTL